MSTVGTAWVDVLPSLKDFGKKLGSGVNKDVDSQGKKAGGRFGKVFASATVSPIRAIGVAAVGLFAADKVVDFFKESIAGARESQKVSKVTEQIIKSTGGAAKLTASQVGDLSTELSNKTGIDDEVIQSGANLLLTFKNVRNEVGKGNDIFKRATSAATDLSAAGFGSVEGASLQLGKALNDPVKGISALSRAGVTFTEQQKKQIKTLVASGKTLDAQKIILGEVEAQVGGTAEASASASDKFKVSFGNFQEAVGQKLIPIIDKALAGLSAFLPKILAFGEGVAKNLGPIFEQVGEAVSVFFTALTGGSSMGEFEGTLGVVNRAGQTLFDFFKSAIPILQNLFKSLAPIVGKAIGTIVTVFGKVIAIVGPIVKQIAGVLVPAFKKALPDIMSAMNSIGEVVTNVLQIIQIAWAKIGPVILPIVKVVFGTIFKVISSVMKIISGIIKLVLAVIKGDWSGAGKALTQIWNGLWNGVKAILSGAIKIIVIIFKAIGPTLLGILKAVGNGIKNFWVGLFNSVRNTVSSGIGAVVSFFKGLPGKALNALISLNVGLQNLFRNALKSAGTAIGNGISLAVGQFLSLPGKIKNALGNLGSLLFNVGRDIIQGLINGLADLAGAVQRKVNDIVNGIKNKIKDALKIGSPSKIMIQYGKWTGEGLAIGLDKSSKIVDKAAERLVPTFGKTLSPVTVGSANSNVAPGIVAGDTWNIYPSAGMDEKALAQKVATDVMRKKVI